MMDTSIEKRIDLAWRECKSWIAEFDGSPTIALLVDAPVEETFSGVKKLTASVENLRITNIAAGGQDSPQFISLEAFPEALNSLQNGSSTELSVNFAIRREAFDLDLHLRFHPVRHGKVAVELVWWSDQVFSSEIDALSQFRLLAGYFIELQQTLSARQLFLSPESGLDEEDCWVEL